MPNGGYPLSLLLTPAQRTDLCLHARGLTLTLAEWTDRAGSGRPLSYPPLATFTEQQSDALLYHLAYWGLGEQAVPLLIQRRGGRGMRPPSAGVAYDY